MESWQAVGDPKGLVEEFSPELKEAAKAFLYWALVVYLPPGWGVRITDGLRTAEYQFGLFKRGRKQDAATGEWVIVDRRQVVTFRDGYEKRSNHQDQDGDGLADAFDFVLTWKGKAVWYPRYEQIQARDPDAMVVVQLYDGLVGKVRDLGLVTGADWEGFFDIYHVERTRRSMLNA